MDNNDIPISTRSIPSLFRYRDDHWLDTAFRRAGVRGNTAQLVAWLQHQGRLLLFAFVIMPTHLHLIIKPGTGTIGEALQRFGSYTAHEILMRLQSEARMDVLSVFQAQKRDPRHRHSVWQDSQAKNISSLPFLRQKLEYLHQNPVAGHSPLVRDRSDYAYSSAGYYDCGKVPIIEIVDLNQWLSGLPSPGTAKEALG